MDFSDDREEDMAGMQVGAAATAATGTDRAAAVAPMATHDRAGGGGGAGRKRGEGGGKYKECLKNHAVSIGGHTVDGCGEFMPAGEEGTLDALKCAACGCHRNFHRKEVECGVMNMMGVGGECGPSSAAGSIHQLSPYYRAPAGMFYHIAAGAQHLQAPPLALPSTSGGGGSCRDEGEVDMWNPGGVFGGGMVAAGCVSARGSNSKKRFRTKFTQEQKDRMLGFAERLGWRIQKHDEAEVQQFCSEIGVRRQVLKVWLHNNKNTLGKKP